MSVFPTPEASGKGHGIYTHGKRRTSQQHGELTAVIFFYIFDGMRTDMALIHQLEGNLSKAYTADRTEQAPQH